MFILLTVQRHHPRWPAVTHIKGHNIGQNNHYSLSSGSLTIREKDRFCPQIPKNNQIIRLYIGIA
jgi:hypothetical protein